MSTGYDTVTFLSDYGTRDEFVGVVTSVLRGIAPHAAVVHLTHEIEPFDVRGGALALARSAEYLCPGVVLAVVDPGVGTARRAVAVEVGGGRSVLVGPDNGLLAPAVAMCGGAERVVELTNADLQLASPGATFDGRDVFAPAAAHLCNGVPLEELGRPVDPASMVPGVLPVPREEDGDLVAEVLWVDRFGNAQLNVDPDDLDGWPDRVRVAAGEEVRTAQRVVAFAELGTGAVGLHTDSSGLLALVADRASAAGELGLHAGAEVRLRPLEGTEGGVSTPVRITRREGP